MRNSISPVRAQAVSPARRRRIALRTAPQLSGELFVRPFPLLLALYTAPCFFAYPLCAIYLREDIVRIDWKMSTRKRKQEAEEEEELVELPEDGSDEEEEE